MGGTKESILLEAERLVSGSRRESYGDVGEDFKRTCALFDLLTGHALTATEGLLFMVCVKLSREANAHKRDNLVDACGYLKLLDDLEERECDESTLPGNTAQAK